MRSFSQISEKLGDTAIFTFGRFNPPTTGHEKLIDALAREQSKNAGSKMYVFPSQSQNPKKDPLPFALKVAYMRKMFPKYAKNIMANKKIRMVFDIAVDLHNKGHRAIVMVVGSDRVTEFEGLLNKYNGVNGRHGYYGFDNIEVVSAGERDPDAEGVSGMSASKMRAAASSGDFDSFKTGVPSGFKDALKLYNDVRKNMGIREERDMGEMTDFEFLRDLYLTGKLWNIGDIVEAHGVKGKVINKGTNYLSFVDENNKVYKTWLYDIVERDYKKEYANYQGTPEQIARRSSRNKARRIMGDDAVKGMDVGHKDNNPMNNDPSNLKNEDPSENRKEPRLREKRTRQDPDIKDSPGTEPAKYYAKDTEGKGMKKSTKQARDAHFTKGTKMDDDNPAAYKPAPGDKGKKTKPSTHTKKFKQMYGEESLNEKRAKQAVSQGKVQKLVTAFGYSFKGKNYKEIDMELKKIDNSTEMVTFNIIHPREIFGNEIKIPFKNLRRGRYMATDTSKINEKLGKNADVGDYVDDFRKSDAPQFKGKSDKKIKDMAVAAYLDKKDKNEELQMEFYQLDEKIEGLVNKAKKTGMPYGILKKVYDRGMAAWRTGHRPGTTPQQWAMARVNSFTTKSSGTWGKADKDLAAKVRGSKKEETELGMIPKKKTKGHEVLGPESVNEWFESNQTRASYQLRYEDDWWWKLNEVHDAMLEKIGADCCDDCSEELDEKYDLYHKDFSSAMQHAYDYAKKKLGITVDKSEIDRKVATGPKKPTEGKTNKYRLKGKGGNLQIQVYNKGGSKPFELNMYKEDLDESLWANIHKKRQRIKQGSGERMRNKGEKGAPSSAQLKRAKGEESLRKVKGTSNLYEPTKMSKSARVRSMMDYLGKKSKEDAEKRKKDKNTSGYKMRMFNQMENIWGEITEKDDKSGKELNNPTRGDVKKYKVYVKNDKGNVVKVEFGDPNMEIKRDDPARRKSFRARHNCDNPGPKYKARYWSCKFWSAKSVTDLMKG